MDTRGAGRLARVRNTVGLLQQPVLKPGPQQHPSHARWIMLNASAISPGPGMAILTSAIMTGLSAVGSAASWAASTVGSLLGGVAPAAAGATAATGSAAGAAGALGGAAGALASEAAAAGAAAGTTAGATAATAGGAAGAGAAGAAATGASLTTKLATAAALGSAGAGIIQATKGAPDLPKPPPPPNPPTIADASVQAAGFNQRQRAAAKGGMGFGNTVTNKGGAQGIPFGSTPGLLASNSLLG